MGVRTRRHVGQTATVRKRTALLAAPRPQPHCGHRPHPSGAQPEAHWLRSSHTPNGGEQPPQPNGRTAATPTRAEPRHYQGKNL